MRSLLRIARRYELRDHGGERPSWRPAPPMMKRGEGMALAYSMRTETRRQIKKQRLEFRS